MKLRQAVKMAAKSISANKGRSALTMLGIIIGLAAVIILVSYAKGQNMIMQEYYEGLGTNKINVSAYSWNGKDVSQALYDYCLRLDDLVVGITPNLQVWNEVTVKFGAKSLSNQNWMGGSDTVTPQITLGSDQYSLCNNYQLESGRDLSFMDIKQYNQVCVLGAAIKTALFNYANPVGQEITINGTPFTVIGVFASKGSDMLSYMDNILLVPYTMNRTLNSNSQMSEYIVKAKDASSTTEAITRLDGFLQGLIDPNFGYYYVYSENTWIDQSNQQNVLQQRFLGGIAAISLLVGGIGIMNIMLVTVTERTREIGIRRAIGAERGSIIAQFLVEAAMICGIGGIFGIGVGYLGTLIMGKITFDTILLPGADITAGAFAISVALGIIFGLYPAFKASGLQPVEALRAE